MSLTLPKTQLDCSWRGIHKLASHLYEFGSCNRVSSDSLSLKVKFVRFLLLQVD